MNNFEFYNPVKIIFGAGEVSQAGVQGAKIGKKALVVSYEQHDFFVDLLNQVYASLQENGVEVVKYNAITANPLLVQVENGVELAKAEGVDFVVAIGGGSAMDAAKCIAAGVLYKEPLDKMIAASHSGGAEVIFPSESLPTMMIPTLPATGSEMNCGAVVTNNYTGSKSYVWDDCLYPQVSIVDPKLTCTLPAYQTASGAIDTISHVMEFYINGLEGTPLNYYLQEGVIKVVLDNLPKVLEDPQNVEIRSDLQWCSIMALNGISQPGNAWTPMHQLAHVISSKFGTAHGATLAIIMPSWMRYMWKTRKDQYLRFAKNIWGLEATTAAEEEATILAAIDKFEKFIDQHGVQTKLSQVGATADDLAAMADEVVKVSFSADGVLPSHTDLTRDMVLDIYKAAL